MCVCVCHYTSLRNQFPLGCAKDSGADRLICKAKAECVCESLGVSPPEPKRTASLEKSPISQGVEKKQLRERFCTNNT